MVLTKVISKKCKICYSVIITTYLPANLQPCKIECYLTISTLIWYRSRLTAEIAHKRISFAKTHMNQMCRHLLQQTCNEARKAPVEQIILIMLLLYSCLSQTCWGLCSINLINLFFSLFFWCSHFLFFFLFCCHDASKPQMKCWNGPPAACPMRRVYVLVLLRHLQAHITYGLLSRPDWQTKGNGSKMESNHGRWTFVLCGSQLWKNHPRHPRGI